MSVVVLDAEPLGLICHPLVSQEADDCRAWVQALVRNGRCVFLPEIIYYEYRREVLRRQSLKSLNLLRGWRSTLEYLAITTSVMDRAAELWANVRQIGLPTAPDPALDIDVILAAQALSLNATLVVATSNPRHLSRFVAAERWDAIAP